MKAHNVLCNILAIPVRINLALRKVLVVVLLCTLLERLLDILLLAGGSTVNVCLLDLSKAFDKMDHSALYLKLMDRSIPVHILNVLQNWFSLCMPSVKWGSVMSHFYELKAGVRQGGVLSPNLFGIYIDGLVKLVDKTNTVCKIGVLCTVCR